MTTQEPIPLNARIENVLASTPHGPLNTALTHALLAFESLSDSRPHYALDEYRDFLRAAQGLSDPLVEECRRVLSAKFTG